MNNKLIAKGRPKLEQGKRIKKIDARFTEEEYASIQELEQTLDIRKSDLIRNGVLKYAPEITVNAKALIGLLDGIGAELGRCGNNINQLARHANTLNKRGLLTPSVIKDFNGLFEQYLTVQKKLETALRKIIPSLGK